jgi:[ribosomal protein S5]-alanine N-acetyltransferase
MTSTTAPMQFSAEGERVVLRTFDSSLITTNYLRWLHDPAVNRYLLKPDINTTLDDIKNYVDSLQESGDNYFLAILMKKDGRHIGNVRLGPFDLLAGTCQYSMMIGDASCHGIGLGTEVVTSALNLCFQVLKFNKVFLEVIEDNKAAIRIYEKNNFVTEGILRQHKWLDGKIHDLRLMSIFNPAKEPVA